MSDAHAKATEALRIIGSLLRGPSNLLGGVSLDFTREQWEIVAEGVNAFPALSAEAAAVPADREALARRPEAAAQYLRELEAALIKDDIDMQIGKIRSPECVADEIAEAAAIIRQPTAAEVEAMAKLADNHSRDSSIKSTNEQLPEWTRNVFANYARDFAELSTFIRRLSPPADGWRPIAEAPKDGTKIDLWYPEYGRRADAYWNDMGGWATYQEPTGKGQNKSVKRSAVWMDGPNPSHWQPLPAPPSSGEATA